MRDFEYNQLFKLTKQLCGAVERKLRSKSECISFSIKTHMLHYAHIHLLASNQYENLQFLYKIHTHEKT